MLSGLGILGPKALGRVGFSLINVCPAADNFFYFAIFAEEWQDTR